MYLFRFKRNRPNSMQQTVRVTAASSRDAWALFEAVYPFRHFTAHFMQCMVADLD